jgi:hypothetical protein
VHKAHFLKLLEHLEMVVLVVTYQEQLVVVLMPLVEQQLVLM